MADHLIFTVQHDDFATDRNEVEITVEVDGDGDISTVDGLLEAVRELFPHALRRAAGAHLVDYDSFGSDSAYLDRCDAVADEMTVVDVSLPGEKTRYAVSGTYSDGGGEWSDWTEATDGVEAEFAAKWTMAENQGSEPKHFENFLDTMDGIDIHTIEMEPITKDEFQTLLADLVSEARTFGHQGPALDAAAEKLREIGIETEPSVGMRL